MKKLFFTYLLFSLSISISSQTIFGKWNSKDDDTGEVESVIEIYEKEEKAYAKIIAITNAKKRDALCDKCTGKNKNKPILGMHILTGLKKDGKEWSGGKILDPKNGKKYKCYIALENKNKLKIRGYIGFAMFGRTAYWERVD